MADAVTTTILEDGPRNVVVHITNVSDGTGESAVTKLTLANLSGAPAKLRLMKIYFATRTMGVDVLMAATSNQFLFHCPASFAEEFDFGCCGGLQAPDPTATGFTGDIKVTTIGHAAGARYAITLMFKKQ